MQFNLYTTARLALALTLPLAVWADEDATADDKKWDVNHPPGESSFVDINVSEGTWMNLDVSPDGQHIAFDLLGDIYLMPIGGGEARNLTRSMAWDMQPRFSPDGRQLAFTSDQGGGDNIWLMNLQGEEQSQLTDESFRLLNNPVWSPDGQYIAARKHFTGMRSIGSGEIWLYHTGGGKGVQLNKRPNEQKDLGEPEFTPDGQHMLFSRDSTPGPFFEYSKDSNNQIYEIYAIELATGEIKPWVSGPGGAARPKMSPDGKTLAFVRRVRNQSTLFLQDLASGRLTPLYGGLERDMQETWAIHGVYPNFSWTPDGKDIVFWAAGKIHRVNVASQAVQEIPFSVKDRREVRDAVLFDQTAFSADNRARMLRWLQKSPDGKHLAFEALGHIYLQKLPDGQPKRLTRQNDHFELYPSFSADSKSIIYTTWDDEKLGSVRIASLSGRDRVITQQPGHYISPVLSPDGQTAVFQAVSGGYITSPLYSRDTGLYTVDLKSGAVQLLSAGGVRPFFADSSERVYFVNTDRQGEVLTSQLVSTDLGGHAERKHYQGPWITDFKVSPDGQWLAFIQNYQVYVTPFVHNGEFIGTGSKAGNLPLQQFSKFAGHHLSWAVDSSALSWSLGPQLHSQKLNEAFEFKRTGDDARPAQVIDVELNYAADVPNGAVLLSGGRVITMQDGQVIPQGDVLVVNNRIEAVGPSGSIEVPAKAEVIDVKGKTLMPGLVDIHWHGPYANSQIIPETSWHALSSLAFGVTTTHNPSANTEEVFAASELQRAGAITAPRIFSTGTILYGATHYFTAPVENLDDAIGHLERMKAVGAFSVKSYNQPRRNQRQQVIEAARRTGLMVFPEGGSLFMHNMSMVVDGHTTIEHSIPVANIYEDVLQLWSGTDTAYTPTLGVGYGGIWGEKFWYDTTEVWKHPLLSKFVPRHILEPASVRRSKAPLEDYNHFNNARVAAQLQQRGVKVLLGAHGQREGLAAHWELWMFVQGGMSPMQALKAGTLDGAEYLGMADELGSLEAGKLADLVILDANPLDDIRNSDRVSMVMLNGRLYEAASMNQLLPEKKARAKFYFE